MFDSIVFENTWSSQWRFPGDGVGQRETQNKHGLGVASLQDVVTPEKLAKKSVVAANEAIKSFEDFRPLLTPSRAQSLSLKTYCFAPPCTPENV